jgi:hypothetical protein
LTGNNESLCTLILPTAASLTLVGRRLGCWGGWRGPSQRRFGFLVPRQAQLWH